MSSEPLRMSEPVTMTARRKEILRIVVQEFVRTAQPVGSNTVSQLSTLNVSPATIRNDLAALETEGLLTHPHTSAGRIPTDAGYRFYVHHLLADAELPPAERSLVRSEFHQARQELDQWLNLSTAVLARTSQSAALATAPRAVRSRYKHMELVAIYGVKVLMVLVLQDGTVKQQLLDLDRPIDQNDLSQISNEMNAQMAGLDGMEITNKTPSLLPATRQFSILVADVMSRLDSHLGGQIFRDGLAQVLEAPEFADSDSVRTIVQVFEQRSLLEQIVGEMSDVNDVMVMIAGDGRMPELRDISLIIGRYGASERATGVLGVIGPMRMAYGRSIGAVRFVAGLMSELVEEIYSP